MPVGDIYQLQDVQIYDGVALANINYFEVTDDAAITNEKDDLKSAWIGNILLGIIEFQSDQLNHDCALIRKVFPTTDNAEVFDVSVPGSVAGARGAVAASFVISHMSGDGARSKNGRWFFSGIPNTFISQGRLEEANRGAFATFTGNIVAEFGPAGQKFRAKHFSKKDNQYYDIAQVKVNPVPGRNRNRTPGLCPIS